MTNSTVSLAKSQYFVVKIGTQYDGREDVVLDLVKATSEEAAQAHCVSSIMNNTYGHGTDDDMEALEDGRYTDGETIFWIKAIIQITPQTYAELEGKNII